MKTSAKNKIILLAVGWVIITASMFFYFFRLLDASNQQIVDNLTKEKHDLALAQAQRQGYVQGQQDLAQLAQEPLQPSDFFSRDITFVKEIQSLEDLATQTNVKMQLGGISGEAATEPKAKTKTAIAQIPYSISLNGNFADVVNFIQGLEHRDFIIDAGSISVNAAGQGKINASFSGSLYIQS